MDFGMESLFHLIKYRKDVKNFISFQISPKSSIFIYNDPLDKK